MIPSTLFAFVAAVCSLAVVDGAVFQRDGASLSPHPTLPVSTSSSLPPSSLPPSSIPPSSVPPLSVPPSSAPPSSVPPSSVPPSSFPPSSVPSSAPPMSVPPSSVPPSSVPPSSPPASVPPSSVPPTTVPPASVPGSSPPPTCLPPSSTPSPPPTKTKQTVTPSATPSPPSGTANCNGVQQWQAAFAYTAGNKVIYNNQLYTALQWTYDNAPPAHPDQWSANGVCAQPINNSANCNGVAAWQSTVAYTSGNQVTYNGHLWSATQWTESNAPGDASGIWKDMGACQ